MNLYRKFNLTNFNKEKISEDEESSNRKMEREPQGSPTNQREDIAVSSQDINKILETRNFFDIAMFYVEHNIKVFPVKSKVNPLFVPTDLNLLLPIKSYCRNGIENSLIVI